MCRYFFELDRRNKAGILPIRRKTQNNQSIELEFGLNKTIAISFSFRSLSTFFDGELWIENKNNSFYY